MVEGASRKRCLPAIGGQADNPPAALGAQMRQGSAYKLDRPAEICGELMDDLVVAEFFRSAEQSVASVADDHVDRAKFSEGFFDRAANGRQVRHVEIDQPQAIAVLGLQIVHCVQFADSSRHTVAAFQQ
jgi:hypothetical protein